MNREDFPILKKNMIYFDNSATTLKPKIVIDEMNKYYLEHTSNIHRGDYDFAVITNKLYDDVRNIIASFVNCNSNEVVYTSGTTMSLNMVVFGYMRKHLKKGDEVLLTKAEHASNILPWIRLSEEIGIIVKYIPLADDYCLTMDNIEKVVTDKTRVISIAHVTNVLGDVRDVKSIGKYCRDNNILFVVDGAQSVPHMKVDFKNSNMDFLCFSAHKMLGPTGVGALIGREELLSDMNPLIYGGGMNSSFNDYSYELKDYPIKLEGGTPPIAQVIGMGEAIKYLMKIGMDKINSYEKELKKYLISQLNKISNIILYTKDEESGIIAFNIDGVFAQDTSIYLNHYNIYVRSGNHCAKILKDIINIKNTVRVSLYFYNTREEIDKLIEVLKNSNDIFKIVL